VRWKGKGRSDLSPFNMTDAVTFDYLLVTWPTPTRCLNVGVQSTWLRYVLTIKPAVTVRGLMFARQCVNGRP